MSPVTLFHLVQLVQALLFPISRRVNVVSCPTAGGIGPDNPECVKFLQGVIYPSYNDGHYHRQLTLHFVKTRMTVLTIHIVVF